MQWLAVQYNSDSESVELLCDIAPMILLHAAVFHRFCKQLNLMHILIVDLTNLIRLPEGMSRRSGPPTGTI